MYGAIALKMLLGLTIVIIMMRLVGRKELAQITPLDLIFVTMISELLGGSITGEEIKVGHLIFVIVLWFSLIWTLERLGKIKRVRTLMEGNPEVIIKNGMLDTKVMKKQEMTMEDIELHLRRNGVFDITGVELAIVEVSGQISVKQM